MLSTHGFRKCSIRWYFHSKPLYQISLNYRANEWNKYMCLFIGFNMVALLFALFLFRLSYSILVEPFYTERSSFLFCFYGNKYTITNTNAMDSLCEGETHWNRVNFPMRWFSFLLCSNVLIVGNIKNFDTVQCGYDEKFLKSIDFNVFHSDFQTC